MTPGIHLLHKPVGPTSHAIIRECLATMPTTGGKRPRKICHGGTLDPFASGLLLILVEPATRLFDHLHDIPKIYEATIRWGIETDNGDPLGNPVFTGDSSHLTATQIEEAANKFIGWHDQIPPPTSAKRIDGERAYEKVHRGEEVSLPPSRVYLHELIWLSHDLPNESRLRITVRGGYYVRAFVRDLGRQLGCGAHITQLHRQSIGPWQDPGLDHREEVHGSKLLPWLSTRNLTDQEVGELRQDRSIAIGTFQPPDWILPTGFGDPNPPIRAFHQGRFCFLLEQADDKLKPLIALAGGV